jgi:hypothetical protein
VDATVDCENMAVPEPLQSVRPYYFSQAPPTRNSEAVDWLLDVTSAAPVTLIHDTKDLTR